ncbi:MBL fold metallo-hydrolase [Kitasatospora sp. NPDC092948]|uniref:MBL fold metallo-hydrolase n=1 Tax=Kitasatospora sp. NPDC092948 TaxID=3364088 RepID=UPI0038227C52
MAAAVTPVQVFGGPTALIEYGGLRLLTDPTFDAAGEYPIPRGGALVKTHPGTVDPAALGPIDAVLLSHDEHPDNLDHSGRKFLADVPLTLTTRGGAERLGGTAKGLAPWQSVELTTPTGAPVTITAVPAQHGPDGCEPVIGEVIGFVLTGPGLPVVYVSGDNASLDVVGLVAQRYAPVDTAVLFAGAARTGLFDNALLTLDSARAAEAARLLGARRVVPVHFDSWAHFTEGREPLAAAFTAAGLSDVLDLA